ncbi:MAG: HAD-IC family P-type ATPase, partial [Methylocystis sp.]
ISLVAFRYGKEGVIFQIQQNLRSDAVETIAQLNQLGFAIEILSGDRIESVEKIANELAIDDWRGALKPADKVARLTELAQMGKKVLMIGDGLNDAPALASAYVSISPVDATKITQAAADAVFLGEPLAPIIKTIELARRARRLMWENLALSVIYNIFAVPLAMAGLLTPLIAAAAMSGSSLLVTVNALRAGDGSPLNKSREEEVFRNDASIAGSLL